MCVRVRICAYRGISSVPLNFRWNDPRFYFARSFPHTQTRASTHSRAHLCANHMYGDVVCAYTCVGGLCGVYKWEILWVVAVMCEQKARVVGSLIIYIYIYSRVELVEFDA